jgi:S1-C subfamily serine protease
VPVPVEDDDGARIASVRASYANYTWGVAGERESVYPSLGISMMPAPGGRSIIDVQKDTVGARAGLKVGDLVTSIDGQPVARMETWNRVMAGKNWGDVVTLGVTRAGDALTLRILLRRAMPEAKPERKSP